MIFGKTTDGFIIISEDNYLPNKRKFKDYLRLNLKSLVELNIDLNKWAIDKDGNLLTDDKEIESLFDEERAKRFPFKLVRFHNNGKSYIRLFFRGNTKKDYSNTVMISNKIKDEFLKDATKYSVEFLSNPYAYAKWDAYMRKIEEKNSENN